MLDAAAKHKARMIPESTEIRFDMHGRVLAQIVTIQAIMELVMAGNRCSRIQ